MNTPDPRAPNAIPPKSCRRCAFRGVTPKSLICCRYPPQVVYGNLGFVETVFPEVRFDTRCGEFVLKED
jgi:hypothetical protein